MTKEKKQKDNKGVKNIKKNKKVRTSEKGRDAIKRATGEDPVSVKKAIIVLLAVVLVVAAVYFVAAILMGEIKFGNQTEKTSIQYEEILAGSTFKKKDKEYIVVYYDFNSDDAKELESTISTYKSGSEAKALYKVNLGLKQNKKYVTDSSSNKKPNKALDLKIKGITLIYIKDGKVNTYIEGLDNIEDYLK